MRESRSRPAIALAAIALVLAGVALLVALDARRSAYRRVVAEVWELSQPVYADFGLRRPTRPPETISEALGPFLEMQAVLSGREPGELREEEHREPEVKK